MQETKTSYDTAPAFEAYAPDGSKHYKVWADGRIEGFGEGAIIVVNRIAPLLHLAQGLVIKSRDNGLISAEQAASILS